MFNGANDITIKDIEEFLNGNETTTPVVNNEEIPPAGEKEPEVSSTQAFAHRLKKESAKIAKQEREKLAKELGYETYDELTKAREKDLLISKGINSDEILPIVDDLVKKRIADDPRIKEYEGTRQMRVKDWAGQELAELTELTDGKITKLEDVPHEVIELWKVKGSLKSAYLELEGESLIKQMRDAKRPENGAKGTTKHMSPPPSAPPATGNRRPLNEKERQMYRLFNPSVTDEKLSQMYKEY